MVLSSSSAEAGLTIQPDAPAALASAFFDCCDSVVRNRMGMNGIDFIKEVRGLPNYKFMPILFLTTESQQAKRMEAKAAGASGWLVKPATADELLNTIKLVLR